MVEGGWAYVWGAYAVTIGSIALLTFVIVRGLRHWANQARDLESGNH